MTVIPYSTGATGLDTSTYIQRVRSLMDDFPQYASENFNGNASQTIFLCTQIRINDDPFVSVTVDGNNVPIALRRQDVAANTVFVDFNTGVMVFGTAPTVGTGNVVINKEKVRKRDTEIMEWLNAGVSATWPSLWQSYTDTSIQLQTNVWDYDLPPLFQLYPGCCILKVELQAVPQGFPEPFKLWNLWETIGNQKIKLLGSQRFPPGATLRVTYAGPMTDLTQLQGRESNLPVLYAAAMLLGIREVKRVASDSQTVAGDGLPQVGANSSAAGFFLNQFYSELKQLTRPIPMAPIRATYNR